jgi:hypothetical protein
MRAAISPAGTTLSFTERAALDEAVSAIQEEGIASFIGSVSGDYPWPADEL